MLYYVFCSLMADVAAVAILLVHLIGIEAAGKKSSEHV